MEVVVSLVTSFIVALIAMIIQKNIFERIEQSIRTKYLVEIEKFRNEFNLKIISIQNENQVSQLRTSLFFDHQRNAFAGILDKISEVNESWFEKEYDEDEGLKGPVPYEKYKELKKLFIQNQLFFDNSCLMAIDLMIDIYDSSFPVIDGAGDIHHRNVRYAYRIVEFIQPKLNSYHFDDISLPPAGNLKIKNDQEPLEAIKIANSNIEELILKLTELQNYLKYEEFYFDRVMDKAEQYLKIISPNENII
jgi:hypothetical protein